MSSNLRMKSGTVIYCVLLVSLLLVFVAVSSTFLYELLSTDRAEISQENLRHELVLLGIGLFIFFLILLRYVLTRLCLVTLDEDKLIIKMVFEKRDVTWEDLEEINKVSFFMPPIWVFRIKNEKKVYSFFSTGNTHLLDGQTKNPMSIENLIERKVAEYRIRQ